MKKDQDLAVITKTYDFILWSCHHTSRFPRNHRFVLGERIERQLYSLLENLIRAKYTRDRKAILEEANLSLEVLRFQIRLPKDLQCLKANSYAFAAEAVDVQDELEKCSSRTRSRVGKQDSRIRLTAGCQGEDNLHARPTMPKRP